MSTLTTQDCIQQLLDMHQQAALFADPIFESGGGIGTVDSYTVVAVPFTDRSFLWLGAYSDEQSAAVEFSKPMPRALVPLFLADALPATAAGRIRWEWSADTELTSASHPTLPVALHWWPNGPPRKRRSQKAKGAAK